MVDTTPTPEVRNLRFPVDASVPRFWHGGRRSVSIFFDGLSIFFPAGERFFVASVKRHRDHVRDPRLREEVAAFCAQEGIHSREHARYNEVLRAHGYPVGELEAAVERLLGRVTRRVPARRRLAITAALEHFTAMMGHLLLADPRTLEGAHPAMAALWRWHAIEENEHKAVAFDVYEAAGGTWAERAVVMLVTTAVFWAKVMQHQVRMSQAAGIAASPREWWALFEFLFVRPGGMQRLFGAWLSWFRPSFHPRDMDREGRLEAWRREYASSLSSNALLEAIQ